MLKLLTKIVGDPNARELKKLHPLVDEINSLEPEMAELNDEQLRDLTAEFKQRIGQGETVGDSSGESEAHVRQPPCRVEQHVNALLPAQPPAGEGRDGRLRRPGPHRGPRA